MAENINENVNPEEVNDKLIELTDEETGESIIFEHLDTIEMNGTTYFALAEYIEEEHEEDDVYIMKVVVDENGEETLEIVENESEVEAVFAEFQSRVGDEYEFLD